jgi:hypothetical protein
MVYAVIRPSEIMTAELSDSLYTRKRKADLIMKKTIAIAAALLLSSPAGAERLTRK